MRMVTALLTAWALLGSALHAGAQQTVVTVDAAGAASAAHDGLTALRDKYAAAVNAADPAALGALYAPDALVVVADGVVLRGAGEIGRYFEDAFAAGPGGAAVRLRPTRFTAEDNVASETGAFSEWPAGAPTPSTDGVYVTIYTRNLEGEWRIAMEIRTRGREKQLVRW